MQLRLQCCRVYNANANGPYYLPGNRIHSQISVYDISYMSSFADWFLNRAPLFVGDHFSSSLFRTILACWVQKPKSRTVCFGLREH